MAAKKKAPKKAAKKPAKKRAAAAAADAGELAGEFRSNAARRTAEMRARRRDGVAADFTATLPRRGRKPSAADELGIDDENDEGDGELDGLGAVT